MGTRRLSRLLLASARRVAPGGESGLGRWSVPALALLLVVYVALSALSANGRASDAATAASRARDVESSAAQASIAPGPASKAALRRSYSDLAAVAGDDPGVGALGRAVDASSGRAPDAPATGLATA